MSSRESSAGKSDSASAEGVEYERLRSISTLEGLVLVSKYNIDGRIIEVETMYLARTDPAPDTSAGWQIQHEDADFMVIQRVLK